ncbi:MAG: heliorhodopsin HeR [Thermoplasmata archaeon]
MSSGEELKFKKLKNFNLAMGFLHLIQGGLMLWLSPPGKAPVYTDFITGFEGGLPQFAKDQIATISLGPLVASFLFVSAIAHFSLSTFGYRWYVEHLKQHINPARWAEYAVSSSIMIVLIAMQVGMFELSTLMLIFALNATMNLFGWMMELHNQTTKKTDWTAYIFGCFAGIVPWIVIGIYFFGAVLQSAESVPTFVYFIFPITAAFFNVFAINMVLQYRAKGRWADYLFGERVYIILSLTAKSTLAWLVFGGTYRF